VWPGPTGWAAAFLVNVTLVHPARSIISTKPPIHIQPIARNITHCGGLKLAVSARKQNPAILVCRRTIAERLLPVFRHATLSVIKAAKSRFQVAHHHFGRAVNRGPIGRTVAVFALYVGGGQEWQVGEGIEEGVVRVSLGAGGAVAAVQ